MHTNTLRHKNSRFFFGFFRVLFSPPKKSGFLRTLFAFTKSAKYFVFKFFFLKNYETVCMTIWPKMRFWHKTFQIQRIGCNKYFFYLKYFHYREGFCNIKSLWETHCLISVLFLGMVYAYPAGVCIQNF